MKRQSKYMPDGSRNPNHKDNSINHLLVGCVGEESKVKVPMIRRVLAVLNKNHGAKYDVLLNPMGYPPSLISMTDPVGVALYLVDSKEDVRVVYQKIREYVLENIGTDFMTMPINDRNVEEGFAYIFPYTFESSFLPTMVIVGCAPGVQARVDVGDVSLEHVITEMRDKTAVEFEQGLNNMLQWIKKI